MLDFDLFQRSMECDGMVDVVLTDMDFVFTHENSSNSKLISYGQVFAGIDVDVDSMLSSSRDMNFLKRDKLFRSVRWRWGWENEERVCPVHVPCIFHINVQV